MHSNVHSSIIYNSQDMEIAEVSIDRRMDKEAVVCMYIYMYMLYEYYYGIIARRSVRELGWGTEKACAQECNLCYN